VTILCQALCKLYCAWSLHDSYDINQQTGFSKDCNHLQEQHPACNLTTHTHWMPVNMRNLTEWADFSISYDRKLAAKWIYFTQSRAKHTEWADLVECQLLTWQAENTNREHSSVFWCSSLIRRFCCVAHRQTCRWEQEIATWTSKELQTLLRSATSSTLLEFVALLADRS